MTVTVAKKVAPPATSKKKEKTVAQQIKDLTNSADSILADLDNAPICNNDIQCIK